jgi:hypothetical protein
MRYWLNHRFWSAIVLVGALIVSPAQLAAQTSVHTPAVGAHPKPAGKLTPRLQMLAQSSQLRLANAQTQARALSLPASGPGSLLKNAQGQLLVYLYTDDLSQANQDAIQAAGATIVHVSSDYHVITVYVSAADLNALAGIQAITGMREELQPIVQGSNPSPSLTQRNSAQTTCSPFISEGDIQLEASAARAAYGINGNNVKVGILADSFNNTGEVDNWQWDVQHGELPGSGNPCGYSTNVTVISETIEAIGTHADEGRAMAQVIHDLVPGAQLGFASGQNGIYQYADNIRTLRNQWHADIIVDNTTYSVEPIYQDGPIAVAISDVVGSGAIYFTAAGNNNIVVDGQNVGSYETTAYRSTTCPADILNYSEGDCHNFSQSGTANTDQIILAPDGIINIILQWNEPWYGVQTDLDLYLLDSIGSIVMTSTLTNVDSAIQVPFESFAYTNNTGITQTYQIAVNRYSGASSPRFKLFFVPPTRGLTSVQFNISQGNDTIGPTIVGHSASKYVMSVAATAYNDGTHAEDASSRGPAIHYYGPVLNTTAAPAISPETLQKPDFTATDGGQNSFYGYIYDGVRRYYGTWAAAPHAAAVSALVLQEAKRLNISYTQSSMATRLKTTASAMSGGTVDSSGAGRVNALAAVDASIPHKVFVPSARK